MLHRERITAPDYVYPADEWRLIEKRFYPRFLGQMESLFALGNGYLGVRGTFDEGAPIKEAGTFINGFHETWPIVYGEEAYGFAKTGQTIINVPDATIIKLYVDDEPFYLPTARLSKFERVLDMKAGTLGRELVWETDSGKSVAVRSRRFVSMQDRHLAAISYEVTVLNASAPVVVSSEIVTHESVVTESEDPRGTRKFAWKVLVPKSKKAEGGRIVLGFQALSSKMTLGCGVDHLFESDSTVLQDGKHDEDSGEVVYSIAALPGVPFRLTKFMTYHTSRRVPTEELCARAERTLDRAVQVGFDGLLEGHTRHLGECWKRSDVEIWPDPSIAPRRREEIQQAIRVNVFHLLQATTRAEGVGIPAKGLTGQGYEGHYFWDAEVYLLPFLTYTAPRIARNLLKFRHSMLEKARKRAREVNQNGALFPWRTINGDEASAYYAAGTAQYHINADIMYALKKYVEVTGDVEFLYGAGVEMLIETARLWVDIGFYSNRRNGQFCIQGVTGPDEYNTVVDNNTFTNLMARENLRYAAETVGWMKRGKKGRYRELVHELGLQESEAEEWLKAAEAMYIPHDEELGIHPQDDRFLDKKTWDFENTPKDRYPLLLNYHPLVIYRYKVIKQADIVLAMFLLGDAFTAEEKKRNFDYYDPLTTGDSSLSVGIQCIIAHEIGYLRKALEYALYSVLMDLADIGGNVSHGVHVSSMGATWMVMTYGFAGMRDYGGRISFNPKLHENHHRLRFPLLIRGCSLDVDISREAATYTLKTGDALTIFHRDKEILLTADKPTIVCPLSE
jgi:alpha,alpha-trehalose phosphorylase